MLFKNLIFSTLLASKVLSSPLHITIDIEEDGQLVAPFHTLDDDKYPYEKVIEGLGAQTEFVELLTNAVLTLSDEGSAGMDTTIQNLRSYAKGLFAQAKDLPKKPFTEGETSSMEEGFKNNTEAIVVLAESVYGYNETIKALDYNGLFYKRYGDARSAFGDYYTKFSKLLYVCDADEKLDGCEGISPFRKEYIQVMSITKTAWLSVKQSTAALNDQSDL